MNLKRMTYKELETKLIENRRILRVTKDLEERRRIVAEDHDLMTEMDSRWNNTKARERKRRGPLKRTGPSRPQKTGRR